MPADIAGIVLSLCVLAVAGDQFIVAIACLASWRRMRATVVGALVGGFGTSIVELIVAALASARGDGALAVGSLVGSIVANVCLALAVAALLAPIHVDSGTIRREAPLSVLSVAYFGVLCGVGLSLGEGVVMLVALLAAVGFLARSALLPGEDPLAAEVSAFVERAAPRVGREALRGLASLALMLGGAELMVTCSVSLAHRIGWAEGFAGLTLVGIGTSAPLIASSIQGIRRGEHDLVVGNVIGGNLFIALGGGAVVSLIAPGHVAAFGVLPLALMEGVVLASWLAMARGNVLARTEAILLLLVYAATLPFVSR